MSGDPLALLRRSPGGHGIITAGADRAAAMDCAGRGPAACRDSIVWRQRPENCLSGRKDRRSVGNGGNIHEGDYARGALRRAGALLATVALILGRGLRTVSTKVAALARTPVTGV